MQHHLKKINLHVILGFKKFWGQKAPSLMRMIERCQTLVLAHFNTQARVAIVKTILIAPTIEILYKVVILSAVRY